jgi:ppGpp synthetase/RelA/SpoT-type nucleotidyltranferase
MTQRTVEDRLRQEYSSLSPEVRRVLLQLQTDVAHLLLGPTLGLKHHERIQIEARAKECDSAIDALRRRQEARQFDEDTPEKYTLTKLPDLAALRILVFPKPRLEEIHQLVRSKYGGWKPDPVQTGTPRKWRAWKYYGHCTTSPNIQAEIQIVPMLTGLFWHVEHDAFYKPRDPVLRGAVNKPIIRERAEAVYDAFEALEAILEQELGRNAEQDGQ